MSPAISRRDPPARETAQDLSSWLQAANFLVLLLTVLFYFHSGPNAYVDIYSVLLTLVCGAENVLILSAEKKRRDPFLVILVFVSTFFYLPRVVTLLYDPWSQALARFPFGAGEMNHALLFIIFANLAIALGLRSAIKTLRTLPADGDGHAPGAPVLVVLLFLLTLGVNYFIVPWAESFRKIAGFAGGILLNPGIVILLTITYLTLNFSSLSRTYKALLFALFPVFLLLSMLQGSRSSFFSLFILALCSRLALKNSIRLGRGALLAAAVLFPLAIFSFFVSTYLRKAEYTPRTMITAERVKSLKTFRTGADEKGGEPLLRLFLDRVGYLSYAADIIAGSERYRAVINPGYYAKSFVDNVITPGFNVFDVPKAANGLRFIYLGLKPNPTHEDVLREYHSDMLTVYGEYYVLFRGYPALFLLFCTAYLFKRCYLALSVKNRFLYYTYAAIVLLLFHNWLNSYGMDWMGMEIISYLVPVMILNGFYARRPSAACKKQYTTAIIEK